MSFYAKYFYSIGKNLFMYSIELFSHFAKCSPVLAIISIQYHAMYGSINLADDAGEEEFIHFCVCFIGSVDV